MSPGEAFILLLMFFTFCEGIGQVIEGEWFQGWIKLGLLTAITYTWGPLQ